MARKLLVIDVAAMGYEFLRSRGALEIGGPFLEEFRPAQSVFPAVTCAVQASFRTASPPSAHGMIANGVYDRRLHRAMFWEQSSDLVAGARIWDAFRGRGGKVGILFWQQSLGESADVILSPAPIHKHHGGMIQDCYSRPAGLYARLCEKIGRPFDLRHYWGPMASPKVGDWIAAAATQVMTDKDLAPDLLMVYLPTLDYDLQRFAPDHPRNRAAMDALKTQLGQLLSASQCGGYEVLVFGDYAIRPCAPGDAAVFPNRALRDAGLMAVRVVKGMLYPDLHSSRAFAMVDHEIAHVYVKNSADIPAAQEVLAKLDGVAEVLDRDDQAKVGIDHANSGELVVIAKEGRWMAYPWWTDKRHTPDYARHIDIHNKPGYDPCELFWGWPPMSVSQDAAKVRGTHGRIGPGREVAWAATFDLGKQADSILDLAAAVRDRIAGA
ncbi:MAG: alkaline phosphatase family protein [Phycisphaerae bacterium]